MKKIININLSGRLIPIEDTAYEQLKNYLDSLKRHFSREQGGDEIVSDIESRIAELFSDILKKGVPCITDQDVTRMIASMGRPEQLADEPLSEPGPQPASGQAPPHISGKRLTRNENDKLLGGVCSGIANYFNIDPVIVRILFVVITIAWGSGILIYIILWATLPGIRNTFYTPVKHKRLYRDTEHRVIAGVCGGIGSYLNVDPVIVRIFFALPIMGVIFFSILDHLFVHNFLFAFSVGSLPTLILIYFILWFAVPKAITVTEKLEMKGERVDLQNITNAMKEAAADEKIPDSRGVYPASPVLPGLENPSQHTQSVPPSQPVYYPPPAYPRRSTLGSIIILLLKILAFIILGFILVILCIALIASAGALMGVAGITGFSLPYRSMLLNTALQHNLVWPAVYLTLGVPVVAIIWFFIRLITGYKSRNKVVGPLLGILWLGGFCCAIILAISLARGFQMDYFLTRSVPITQPSAGKLIIREAQQQVRIGGGYLMFGNFIRVVDDTIILKDIRLDIEKSQDDSFRVDLENASRGGSLSMARNYAEDISYLPIQDDSVLYLPSGISIPKTDAYRNQRVRVRIYVPLGKEIRVEHQFNGVDAENWVGDNIDYQMTPAGLIMDHSLDTMDSIPEPHQFKKSLHSPYRYKGPPSNQVEDSGRTSASGLGPRMDENLGVLFYSLF
ncbi:MAG TPA: PspC domain-containing protein [Chitinophagaceae bacterium]|nr:PspC domain-containing protein [Chitinophagaceae bacterium]